MIIVAFPYGNYSNRLFQNLHFEAFCYENNIEFLNPTFADIQKYYVSPCNLSNDFSSRIIVRSGIIKKILSKLDAPKSFKNLMIFDIDERTDIANLLLQKSAVYKKIFVGGWGFRVHNLTEKYQDYFIGKYSIKKEFVEKNDILEYINTCKKNGSLVIGIHIRRGDYKQHCGGKYYYDDATYQSHLKKIEDEVRRKLQKDCCFIIFSNETTTIKEDQHIRKSNHAWYIDHYLMSTCDLLAGPPSTFTLWASYIGKVKYNHIENKYHCLSLDDFVYCRG